MTAIDTSFDFRLDTPPGADPDAHSPTLRRYHQLLWSKELPSGQILTLDASLPDRYLSHRSELGDFSLSSDSVMQTFTRWVRMQHIVSRFSEEENEAFRSIGYTIGGMMVWPNVPADGQRTINVERGFNSRIADRMDLTLECVRRHYEGGESPMAATLAAYSWFFDLFRDFRGFVRFFLLEGLVNEDLTAVRFFLPFDGFEGPAMPSDVAAYRMFRRRSIRFTETRNRQIEHHMAERSHPPTSGRADTR